MDAITVTATRIRCDTCQHTFAGEVPEWHNKPCPQCGAPNIITDRDMEVFKLLHAAKDVFNLLAGDIPEEQVCGSSTLTVNTAGLSAPPGTEPRKTEK